MALKTSLKSLIIVFINHSKDIIPLSLSKFALHQLFGIDLVIEKDSKEFFSVCRYKNGARGAFCFSIDYDLLPQIEKKIAGIERVFPEAIKGILRISEQFGLPITWGICGETAARDQNLLLQISSSKVDHDVGVHTFSHIDLSDERHQTEEVRSDIKKCIEVVSKDLKPTTFIFPYNRESCLGILKELGFASYRGDQAGKISQPIFNDGLWNIQQTYYLTEKAIHEARIIQNLIDIAITYEGVFHLWTHPWNLHSDGEVEVFMEKTVLPMIRHADKRRQSNKLWICSMRELANYAETRRNCHLESMERREKRVRMTVGCKIDDDRYDFPPIATLRIQVPSQMPKVVLDGTELSYGENWWKNPKEPFIYLTLNFEREVRHIEIL